MQKKCSKCNIPFACQNEGSGCWCEILYLTQETLKELKERFADKDPSAPSPASPAKSSP